jgi:hypothetical protein
MDHDGRINLAGKTPKRVHDYVGTLHGREVAAAVIAAHGAKIRE